MYDKSLGKSLRLRNDEAADKEVSEPHEVLP